MAKKANKKPTETHTGAIKGFLLLTLSFTIFLSVLSFLFMPNTHNLLGLIGHFIGNVCYFLFGIGTFLFCLYLGWIGALLLFSKPVFTSIATTIYFAVFVGSFSTLLSLVEDKLGAVGQYHMGGALFYYLYHDIPYVNLLHVFNATGVFILAVTTLTASLLFLTKTNPADLLKKLHLSFKKEEIDPTTPERYVALRIPSQKSTDEMLSIQPETNLTARPSLSQKKTSEPIIKMDKPTEQVEEKVEPQKSKKEKAIMAQKVHNGDFEHYQLPSPSLLKNAKKTDQSSLKQGLKRQAEVLEETLLSFGIEAKVGQINCGPTITSFEVHPSIGVKVQKIKTLENDIALNMEAKSIRIIAPIPGKAAVGIEVPNQVPQEVGYKEMLMAYQSGTQKFHIPILLGKAVNGDYVMNDLAKMPHCIIAGATGSGKSVCINTIVMSIVMNAKPDEVKLVMVDPKKVELTPYSRLPHMLAPVITEPQGACAALNWLVKEMEDRYEILKHLGVRNIDAFNKREVNHELEQSLELKIPAKMTYIVVIIDELADLMMVSSNDIETPIARIAQMARAVGIHLILATQRPSREVITGLIKANFPTRIAFKVASRINSQIILDESGAESLLGNGDMLFLPPGTSTLVRAQGAFIRDEDIASVVKTICDQAPPNYSIASFDQLGKQAALGSQDAPQPNDSLYNQAQDIVIQSGNASTTFLQRKLKIGYARAASLIDELEDNGIVTPSVGGKPRKVLHANQESVLEELLE